MSRRNGVKDMNNLIMALLTMLGLLGCKGYSNLKVDEFENMLSEDKTVQLVDVRTPQEYASGHLPGAININWQDDGFIENAKALLSTKHPVMVYCRSGKRSAAAAAKLDGNLFKTYNLLGGYLAWTEAGKSVSTYDVEGFKTASGEPLAITLIKHASLEIRYKGLSIQIDPVSGYGKPTDYATEFPKADIILITHEHGDHFDKEAIATPACSRMPAAQICSAGEKHLSMERALRSPKEFDWRPFPPTTPLKVTCSSTPKAGTTAMCSRWTAFAFI